MKRYIFCKLTAALAAIALMGGCAAPVIDTNLNGSGNSFKIGARRVTGKAISVAVVSPADVIFKVNAKVEPAVCTFIPPDGTPVKDQASRVAHDKDATSVVVYRNYGKHVGEIVKANFETRFEHADVVVSPTPGKADCVIEPHESFIPDRTWGGMKSTVSLAGTYGGKRCTAESTCTRRISPVHLAWQIPLMVATYPIGTLIIEGIDSAWIYALNRKSASNAWSEASGKLADQLAP